MDTTIPDLPIIAFIYKLTVGDKWYIGSSFECIQGRMSRHYRQALETPDRKLYKAVAELGGWKNVNVEIISTFSFKSKEDICKEEDIHIKLDDPLCLNTRRAILSEEERAELKREIKRRCWKRWMQDPAFKEAKRERARALYEKQKQDPAYMERKRKIAQASYQRKKSQR